MRVTLYVVTRGGVPIAVADTRNHAQRRALLEERADWASERMHVWREGRHNVWHLYVENPRSRRFNRTWWAVREVPHTTGNDTEHTRPSSSTITTETIGSAS